MIDVVIPLYNKEKVIQRAIDSVLDQSYKNWNLYIVNDGSTDSSILKVKKYLFNPKIFLINQKNKGPGSARNVGLKCGSSEYVAFLDADDEWTPHFLDITKGILEENSDCAAVCTSWYYGSEKTDMALKHSSLGFKDGYWRCPVEMNPSEFKKSVDFFHSSAVLSRRECIENLGGFYDKTFCTYGEDSFLWVQLILNMPVYRLIRPLIHFHTDQSHLSFGRTTAYPIPPILENIDIILNKCPESHLLLLKKYIDWYTVKIAHRLLIQDRPLKARKLLKSHDLKLADGKTLNRSYKIVLASYIWPLLRIFKKFNQG